METHGLVASGTSGTTAASKTQIGSNITLPAGGPWVIYAVWALIAKVTTVPAEGTGGQLIIESLAGDITPDPAPGKWPLIGSCVTSSVNSSCAESALSYWPTRLEAAGKATVALYHLNQLAITTASRVVAGILFDREVPPVVPSPFCDGVYSSFASATEQTIGTITLSERATKITGILCDLNKGDALTNGEPVIGYVRLASDDLKMAPAYFPFNRCFNAGDGTVEGESATGPQRFIPVDIPVKGGARITVYATTPVSVTGNADVNVFLMYE